MANERYQLQRIIGQGPMSVVWLAHDTYTQKPVAFKIMTIISEDDRRNRKAYERFVREIEIARSLQHPYILQIIDYGEYEHENSLHPFLVTPYIQEGSLADLIKTSPPWKFWSLLQTMDVILQAAESLWYLHTRSPQIVHQDVKPGNFLVRSVQSPRRVVHLYLCDFGISRWQKSSSMLASEVLGTFAYMAPEQVARKVNAASDQYALAVMTCYLLTGKLPIQAGTNEEYAQAHVHNSPYPPSKLNPKRINSSAVDAVILRALAKNPGRRFPTILEFAQALERVLLHVMQARATASTERLALAETSIRPDRQQMPPVVVPPLPPRAEPEMSIALDAPDKDEGHVLDEPLPAKLSLESVAPAGNGEFTFARLPLTGPIRRDLPARPRTLSWSRDGKQIACTCYGHAPILIYRDGSVQEVRGVQSEQASCLCWSANGGVLAISAQGEIHFWDVKRQEMLPLILQSNIRTVEGLDWSARGQLALWVENQIRIYNLSSPTLTVLHAPMPQVFATGKIRCGNTGTLRWSYDGTLLMAGGSNGGVLCWNVARQSLVWQVAPPGQKVTALAWSPDGMLLAVAFRDNRVVGWNVPTRMQAFLWEKLPAMPRTLSISIKQRIIIASSEKRLLSGLSDEQYPSTALPGQLLVAWSPASTELAAISEQRETSLAIWGE